MSDTYCNCEFYPECEHAVVHLDQADETGAFPKESSFTLTERLQAVIEVGWKLWFYGEPSDPRHWFKVRCISPDRRYMICTRPFNPRQTVLYCILDFDKTWRAPDDRIFSQGYETQEQIERRMRELRSGRIGLSRRHGVSLTILAAKTPGGESIAA